MSTFRDLQDEVLEHQLNDTKYRPSIKRWLNDAQNRIARQATISDLYTTIEYPWGAGLNRVTLPDDYARRIEVADSSSDAQWRLLSELDLSEFDMLAESSGAPMSYTITGNVLYLYPTPDRNVTIVVSYYRLPVEMVADSDEPEIPGDYHYLLPYWALYRAFSRENDMEQGTYWKNEWVAEFEKLKGDLQYMGQTEPSIIPGTYEDGIVPGHLWY